MIENTPGTSGCKSQEPQAQTRCISHALYIIDQSARQTKDVRLPAGESTKIKEDIIYICHRNASFVISTLGHTTQRKYVELHTGTC